LSRDVLLKWEMRYQFPLPQRGVRGQREYLQTDVDKLTLISHLLKQGLRAGALVQHNTAQLQALLEERSRAPNCSAACVSSALGWWPSPSVPVWPRRRARGT
jgi:DNA-binding transcriptional MerR regulator